MKLYSVLIVISLLFFSCKKEKNVHSELSSQNRFEKDWSLFQNAVVNKAEFNWNTFVEIEGQQGEDYKYLFETTEAIEKIGFV